MATPPSKRRIPLRLIWVVAAATGTNHLVTETAFADGMAANGTYRAICGVRFSAAPMIEAPHGTCAACRGVVAAIRAPCRREERGIKWWRRLQRRRTAPSTTPRRKSTATSMPADAR